MLKKGVCQKTQFWVVILIFFLLIYAVSNIFWLFLDTLPPAFDQSAHLLIVLKFSRLFDEPHRLSLTKLIRVSNYWPPFFHFSAAWLTKIFGFSADKVALTNFFFLIFLAFGLFKLSQHWFDPESGFLAVFLTLMSPLVFGLVRDNLIDFCLLTMVVCVQYLIIESSGGWNLKLGFLLGIAMGFSLLTKWTAPTFFAFTAILIFFKTGIEKKKTFRQGLLAATAVILVALILSLPWYLKNLADFRAGSERALLVDSKLEGDPTSFWPSFIWYLTSLKEVIISSWLFPFFLIGLCSFFLWAKNWAFLFFTLAWILPALFIFVLISNKDARFILPIWPALALLSGAGLRSIRWERIRIVLIIMLIIVSCSQFIAISFGWPKRINHPYAFQVSKENWPIEEILADLASSFPGKELRLAVLANVPYFHSNAFRLFCALKKYPYEVEEIGGKAISFTQLLGYHFLILKTGEIALEHTAHHRLVFLEKFWSWLEEGRKYPSFHLWKKWPLPDRSEALVYKIEKE